MGFCIWDLDLREADSGRLGIRARGGGGREGREDKWAEGSKTGLCGHRRSKTRRRAGEEMPRAEGSAGDQDPFTVEAGTAGIRVPAPERRLGREKSQSFFISPQSLVAAIRFPIRRGRPGWGKRGWRGKGPSFLLTLPSAPAGRPALTQSE